MNEPTVLVTGAAAGIGHATARRFAAAGYHVGAFDIDEPGLVLLRDECGDRIHIGLLDVRDPLQWEGALREFCGDGGSLDILVNNAGVLGAGPFEDIDVATHRRVIEINVAGTVFGTRAAFPYLRAAPRAQVVNLCSASAIYGQPELATYSASKFAVRGLTEALDLEWRKHGIRVVAVWPLFVRTGMLDGVDIGSTRSLGVRLTPDDVAAEIFAVTRPKRQLLPRVHYPVGLQAKVFAAMADIAPGWIARTVNRYLTHS